MIPPHYTHAVPALLSEVLREASPVIPRFLCVEVNTGKELAESLFPVGCLSYYYPGKFSWEF